MKFYVSQMVAYRASAVGLCYVAKTRHLPTKGPQCSEGVDKEESRNVLIDFCAIPASRANPHSALEVLERRNSTLCGGPRSKQTTLEYTHYSPTAITKLLAEWQPRPCPRNPSSPCCSASQQERRAPPPEEN